jgi:hypothetical protein
VIKGCSSLIMVLSHKIEKKKKEKEKDFFFFSLTDIKKLIKLLNSSAAAPKT